MKLLITGGHVTPALAFIDEMIARNSLKASHIVFVGRKYISAKEHQQSFEYSEILNRKIKFINLTAGRLTRIISLQSIKNILLTPVGFAKAWQILSKEKPYAVLSFGGYIALPIACMAAIRRIPVFTHEQTLVPGLTNRIIGRFAQKIFVSFPQTASYFPKGKTVVSGNPVRRHVFAMEKAAFTLNKVRPVIYVTGASIGSHSINTHIERLLPELLEHYTVIHQTGNIKKYHDFERLSAKRNSLAPMFKSNYIVKTHFTTEEVGHVFMLADLVVSRSGANTVFELLALKKPAVLIPLPWSAHHEQMAQAKMLEKAGVVEIFKQKEKSEKLLTMINKMMDNLQAYRSNYEKLEGIYKPGAVEIIAKHVIR